MESQPVSSTLSPSLLYNILILLLLTEDQIRTSACEWVCVQIIITNQNQLKIITRCEKTPTSSLKRLWCIFDVSHRLLSCLNCLNSAPIKHTLQYFYIPPKETNTKHVCSAQKWTETSKPTLETNTTDNESKSRRQNKITITNLKTPQNLNNSGRCPRKSLHS